MKALAGMLLAFGLAAGIGNQVDARQCTHKHVSKTTVKHHGTLAKHSSKKTSCVCTVGKNKTKHAASKGMMKTSTFGGYKPINSTMMNTMESTDTMFNGNRSLNNSSQDTMFNGNRNLNLNNGIRNMDTLINPKDIRDNMRDEDMPKTDSLNDGSSGEYMDHGK